MSNQRPEAKDRPALHVEVAVAVLLAGLTVVGGLIATIWTEDWTPALLCSVAACGLVFVAACIPQIKAALAAARAERDAE